MKPIILGSLLAATLLALLTISQVARGEEAQGVCQPVAYAEEFVKRHEATLKMAVGKKRLYIFPDGQWMVLEWHEDKVCLTASGEAPAPETP